ncbi:ComEC/Rec2 family competence protein, partial [bacterium]|nr:ComEC/Rec2 family competence protein [bacterium]
MIKLIYFLSVLSGIFIGFNFRLNIFYFPFIFFISLLTKKKTFILSSLFFISTFISTSISNRGEKSKFNKEIEKSKFVIVKTESISPFSSSFIGQINSEKYLLRFKKRIELDKGEIIEVKKAKIKEIEGKKNPWDFDRKKYYNRRGIFYQLKVEEFERTGYKNTFYKIISKIRKKGKEKIKKNLLYKPEGRELIETIVIGKDKMPYFLKTLGIKSGSYHLLVISGLHLSFIFFFLKVLFLPLMRLNNTHPKVFPFFALLSIWFYAFITGLRIPVVRASLMFTFFLLGEIFERDIEGPDSVFIAAFILLLLNPFSLFNLSFLLSFITTFTIIYTVRKFNYIRNPFLMFLLITTFAQISAFPVILYNFKRFYITGFFSNIFLIPLSVGLIISSLLSFIFPFLFTFAGFLADIFLKLMHIFSFKSPEFNFLSPLS